MSKRLNEIKERAARMKWSGVYETQSDVDREYLLEVIDMMEQVVALITEGEEAQT